MDSFSIGLSGLKAAQRSIDTVGNNIANAATEGYHRQRLNLSPAYTAQIGNTVLGGGVQIAGVTRFIDTLLASEMLGQQSHLGQISQELSLLQTAETMMGELTGQGGLSAAIDEFFGAMQDLSAHPDEIIWQTNAVSAAQKLSDQFRMLGSSIQNLQDQIVLESETIVKQINLIGSEIANLNNEIQRVEINGGKANNLQDQRDQKITELSKLIGVEVIQRKYGVKDVNLNGMPLVSGQNSVNMQIGYSVEGKLGVTMTDGATYSTRLAGGKIGGLVNLRNELINDLQGRLDNLAGTIIREVNSQHAMGISPKGSFTELTSSYVDGDLSELGSLVQNGRIFFRVTDTATGQVARHSVLVDPQNDTLSSIATKITMKQGLNASVVDSRLSISATSGYEFDFLPEVLPKPSNFLSGSANPPSIDLSGFYSGDENKSYRLTVTEGGDVSNGNLQIKVTTAGQHVKTINVGSDYAAGDKLEIGDGVYVSFSSGELVTGDQFDVHVFADTDTSGLVSALGLNSFFQGHSAIDMKVSEKLTVDPSLIASSMSTGGDNKNILKILSIQDQNLSSLDSMSAGNYYRRLITDLGQQISIRDTQKANSEMLIQNLNNQRNELSGVDINEEAAQMLVFEQMFQAMAKYISTVQTSMNSLMSLIG